MPAKTFCGGFIYGHDQWKNYWEGTHKRENLNLGKITTQSITYMGTYGLNDKINLIAMVPYVWTKSSGPTLSGLQGVQDLTLAVKYNFFAQDFGNSKFKTFATGTFSTPLTNYSPDFLPMSIGLHSKNLSGRLTLNYTLNHTWYLNASGAYTWRSNVTLDRPSYYTDGQLYLTNEVWMPNVVDFIVNAGYHKHMLQAEVFFTAQNTLAGGDIRRQDMPFVSYRMNASKVGALILYHLGWPKNLAVRASASYVVDGRNVGQTTSLTAGLMYTVFFSKNQQSFEK